MPKFDNLLGGIACASIKEFAAFIKGFAQI